MLTTHLKIFLAFLISTFVLCVLNFIAQIALIFIDIISRWESTSALTIVLWIVTGVFGAIFTESAAGLFINKNQISYRLIHTPVLFVSLAAILLAVFLMVQGEFIADPSEFTLLFSNGIVFISYFIGSAGFAFLARKL